MFMPPGCLVVEITSRLADSKFMPLCGYIGPFSAIFGQHHLLFAYDYESGGRLAGNKSIAMAMLAREFYMQLHRQEALVL